MESPAKYTPLLWVSVRTEWPELCTAKHTALSASMLYVDTGKVLSWRSRRSWKISEGQILPLWTTPARSWRYQKQPHLCQTQAAPGGWKLWLVALRPAAVAAVPRDEQVTGRGQEGRQVLKHAVSCFLNASRLRRGHLRYLAERGEVTADQQSGWRCLFQSLRFK